jgi:SAM-dependent methyltransferase
MKTTTNPKHECESSLDGLYDSDFAAMYWHLWDPMLIPVEVAVIDHFYPHRSMPTPVLDVAAGTGGLAAALASRGVPVVANEYSTAMRGLLERRRAEAACEANLIVVPNGLSWRELRSSHHVGTYPLVVCLGAALCHCDNRATGVLRESLAAIAQCVAPGGFLLVDAKRYSPRGFELRPDGQEKPREDTIAIPSWVDARGRPRTGSLTSTFSICPDGSLHRKFTFRDNDSTIGNREWIARTWPVDQEQVAVAVQDFGLQVAASLPMGSPIPGLTDGKHVARFDYVLFSKGRV